MLMIFTQITLLLYRKLADTQSPFILKLAENYEFSRPTRHIMEKKDIIAPWLFL